MRRRERLLDRAAYPPEGGEADAEVNASLAPLARPEWAARFADAETEDLSRSLPPAACCADLMQISWAEVPEDPGRPSAEAMAVVVEAHSLSPEPLARVFGDFKDTVCPFFESDTLFLECDVVLLFSCLAILRVEGCLKSTL